MYPFAGLWFALKITFPLIDDDDMEASWLDDWVTLLDFELSGSASSSFLSNWPENGLSFNPAVCVQVYSSEKKNCALFMWNLALFHDGDVYPCDIQ